MGNTDDIKKDGHEEDLLFQAIGYFAVSFEKMCDEMRECVSGALQQGGLSNTDLAYIVVADLTADPLKKLVGAMFVASWPKDLEGQKKVSKLLKRIQDIISTRNKILHGTWEIGYPFWTDDTSVAEGYKWRASEKKGVVREWMDFKVEDFDWYANEAIDLTKSLSIVRLSAFRGLQKSDTVDWYIPFDP